MSTTPHLSYQPATRAPPPSGNPPAYARIYPYSLRPLLLVSTIVSFFYLIILGIASFKAMGYQGETAKLKTFDAVTGALFIGAAAVEVFGFIAAWTQRIPLARLYSNLSLLAFLAVMASELISIVTHFTLKGEIIDSCTVTNTGRSDTVQGGFWWNSSSSSHVLTADEARDDCTDQWSKGSAWNIIWFVVTAILGALFVAFSFAFVRQLLDPSSVRIAPRSVFNRQSAPSQQYSQNPYYNQGPYDPSNQQQRYDPESAFSYPPPPGPPPSNSRAYGNEIGNDLPEYDSRGRNSLDDSKTPVGYGYGGYERESIDGARAESSRRPVYRESSEDKGRGSDETLREREISKSKESTNHHDEDDGVPRI